MTYTNHPKFTGRNVPIAEIARATGKNPQFIRIGLRRGILPFGIAMKNEGSSEYTYYCSDKLVWEATGYFNDKVVLARQLLPFRLPQHSHKVKICQMRWKPKCL